MKIKKINFRVLPVRPEVTPIQTKKSEISLRQCFCLGTGNKQNCQMKKCNSCILLFIRLTKTVKEKQLNLITTWFIWTLPDRIGSDSYNKMTPVKHIFNYMSMIHNKFESWSLTINWDLAVQNLKKEGFLRYFRYLTGSRNYLCSLHCIDENLIINTEISITYLIKN